ncbi:hypothetical protein GQX74_001091 [Glossina fuscipes]|nr:hypothetical protein GQX74_001091 [Glossina fuscipes]
MEHKCSKSHLLPLWNDFRMFVLPDNTGKQTSVFQNIHPTQLVSAAIEHNAIYNVMDTEIWFLSDYHSVTSRLKIDDLLKAESIKMWLRSCWFSIFGSVTANVGQIKVYGNWRIEVYPQYRPVDFG